jgi:hypothetical protein
MRLQIRDTLQKLGHTVYLSEQLGIPASASTQKAVEYLQHDAVDLTIAIQSSYGLVGTVTQFVEFRVVDSKMLLFIDAAAQDNYLYDRAVSELKNLYDNVDTFQLPDDIVRDGLQRRILVKVGLMQIVKHLAIQRARGWGLRLEATESGTAIPLQPFRYNLLELYREHRDEIDAFNDLMRVFFLAYMNSVEPIPLTALSKDVGLSEDSLLQQMAPLLRGEMISQANGILTATAYGKRMLDGLNLAIRTTTTPPPPIRQVQRILPPIMRTRLATLTAGAGLVLAAVFLFVLALINSVNPVQNQQPLVLTPLPPAITATATLIPPASTPAPPR